MAILTKDPDSFANVLLYVKEEKCFILSRAGELHNFFHDQVIIA